MKSWRTAATLILTTPSSNTRAICGKKKVIHGCFSTNYAVLMLQRSSKNNFFPNAYVFPGGGLDHADATSKWLELFDNIDGGFVEHLDRLRLDPIMRTTSPMMLSDASSSPDNLPPDISYRICAIRETFEETGLLLARTKVPSDDYMLGKKHLYARTFNFDDSDTAKHWRKEVTEDAKNFLKLCHHFKCVPDIWCLHEWSNWLTPICKGMKPTKRYDTIFYKAAIQNLPQYLVQDNQEISKLERKNPEFFLEDYFNDECQVGNPQIYELLRLVNISEHEDLIKMANSTIPEDGKVYFITNKKYNHARLAQWGTKGREMGTYETKVHSDQMWVLKEDAFNKGWFHIENAHNTGYRVAKWGSGDSQTGIYNGQYYEDQLWKFVPAGERFYYIYNKKYPKARLAKWGKGDGDWGSYAGDKYEDQLWFFTPRFEAKINMATLWEADNRQGCQDFSEKVTITTGLKLTKSSTFSTKTSLKRSLEAALDGVFSASAEMKVELSNTLSTGSEQSWSTERQINFKAPPGKNYRVRQPQAVFTSLLHDDDCAFTGTYKIEESTKDFEN